MAGVRIKISDRGDFVAGTTNRYDQHLGRVFVTIQEARSYNVMSYQIGIRVGMVLYKLRERRVVRKEITAEEGSICVAACLRYLGEDRARAFAVRRSFFPFDTDVKSPLPRNDLFLFAVEAFL